MEVEVLHVGALFRLAIPDQAAADLVNRIISRSGNRVPPLAVGFGYRPHLVTGLAMTAWALAYPALFAACADCSAYRSEGDRSTMPTASLLAWSA